MIAILRKELADYFTSLRCFILFLLVILASAGGIYAAHQGIREAVAGIETGFVFIKLFTTPGENIPSLVNFITLFVPIIGIALGFDAINREHTSGTMSRILAQPVFRDSVINGKFLAGIVTLSIMMATTVLIVSGFGLVMIGVPPTAEEVIRLFIYLIFIVIYGAFWMGLAILFSTLFRSVAISLLSPLAVWLFFGFFYTRMIVPAIAKTPEMFLMLLRFSPDSLFGEATVVLLQPLPLESLSWIVGLVASGQAQSVLPNPLSLSQSLLLIWPQLTSLIALSIICFAISYVIFMRQEIRAT